ncbi:MAG: hypothetical protein WCL07_01815 [bacterium]
MFSLRNIILTVLVAVLLAEVAGASYFVINKVRQTPITSPTPKPIITSTKSSYSSKELDDKYGNRPNYCEGMTATTTSLSPKQTSTITLTSNTPVNQFFLAAYNTEEAVDPTALMLVCVEDGNVSWACPSGGHILNFLKNDKITLRTSETFTISYADLFVLDRNTDNLVTSVGLYGHFQLDNGRESERDQKCLINILVKPEQN